MKHRRKLKCNIIFKRWSRKGYSLFQILNKVVSIGVLSMIYLNASAARNQVSLLFPADTTQNCLSIELEEVSISGKKTTGIFPDEFKIVNILTPTELERSSALNLTEILRQASLVDVRQRGAEDIQVDISIRGGTFDQTTILFNGINITDPQTGHYSLDLPVSFRQINQIEIIGGGGASQNGSPDAFSGAVNIITKPAAKNCFNASMFYGSHNLRNPELSGTVVTEKINHLLAASWKKSDGYIKNTDFDTKNIFLHSSGDFNAGKLDIMLGVASKEFGANAFYSAKYPEQFEAINTAFAALKWTVKSPVNLTPALYWRRHKDRFELFRYEKPEWYGGHNYHLTDVLGSSMNAWILTAAGKTSAGTGMRSESIWSNVLGDSMGAPVKVRGADAVYNKSKMRTHFSAFMEHTFYYNNWILSGRILYHHSTDSGMNGNFYPTTHFNCLLLPSLRFYASASRSFRLPTFTDLYYSGPVNIGNPSLKPEETTTFDFGLKYNGQGISAMANLYHQKGKNLIDWIKYHGEEAWKTENLTTLRNNGLEASLSIFPEDLLHRKFFISKMRMNYITTQLKKQENDFISYYVLDNLKHKLNVNISHVLPGKFDISWSLAMQQRNGKYVGYDNGVEAEMSYQSFWLLDCKLAYATTYVTFHLLVNNLTNTDYIDIGNIKQPGRGIKFGININID